MWVGGWCVWGARRFFTFTVWWVGGWMNGWKERLYVTVQWVNGCVVCSVDLSVVQCVGG